MAVDAGTAQAYLDIDISKYSAGLDAAIEKTKQSKNSIESAGDKITNVGNKISSVGSTLTKKVTLPIVGLATAAIKTTADFETSMSSVAAISGATGKELDQLTAKAREMGAKTKFSASESADAFKYMAMAGWKTADMLDGIEGIMSLAAASGEDLATTSDIVTDALTAFGLSAADSTHFADVMAAASNNANTNVSMMGETFKYVAPIAGAMGYSIEDTAEAIGLLANAGIKGSQAGTTLRAIMTSLNGEIKLSGKELGEVTIQTTNADGSMRGFTDILTDCRSAFSQLSESEQINAAQTLVGKEAMSGFLTLMNSSPADIDKLRNALSDADGTAQKMASTMQDNLTGKLTILKSSLEELAISFGTLLMPAIDSIVDKIQGFTDKLNSLDEGQKNTIIRILEIAAVVGPILLVVGKLTSGIGNAVSAIGKISGAFGSFSSAASSAAGPASSAAGGMSQISSAALNLLAGGAGILMAAAGLALLANAAIQIASAGWPAAAAMAGLVAAMALLAVGAAAIGPALTAGAVGLVAFGASVALIGVGVLAAGAGISLLATQLPAIAANGAAASSGLVALSAGLLAFAGPAALAGASLVAVGAGMATVGTGAVVAAAGVLALGAAALVLGAGVIVAGAGLTLCGAGMGVIGANAAAATAGLTALSATAMTAFVPFVAGAASCAALTAATVALVASVAVLAADFGLVSASGLLLLTTLVGVRATMASIKSSATTSAAALSSMVSAVDVVQSGLSGLESVASSVLDTVVQKFTKTEPEAKTQATVLANGIVYGFQTGMNKLPPVVNTAVAPVKALGEQAYYWGADIASGIAKGLESKKGAIKSQVDDIADYIYANLHFSKPDEGPLRNYETWMPDFVHGLANGIYKSSPELKSASQYLVETLSLNGIKALDSSYIDSYSITILNVLELYRELLSTMKELSIVSRSVFYTDSGLLDKKFSVKAQRETYTNITSKESPQHGDTFNFYSPKPIDEIEAAKQMKRVKRALSEGF